MKYYFNEIGSYFGSIMRDELEDEYMSVSKFYVDTFNLNEWHIYGSSRLGVYNADLNLVNVYFHADTTGGDFDSVAVQHTYVASPNYNLFNLVRGAKRYELSNWLENVNVVVTDKKIPVCYADTVHHYIADVISAQDYSPFGAPLPDRSYDLIRDQSHNIIHTDSFNSTTEDWVVASGTASLAQASGRLKVTINSSGASAREYFPTVRYNKYVYSVRIDTGNIAGIIVAVKDSISGSTLATQTVTVSGNYSLSFTAAGPSTYLYVTQTGTYSAGKIFFVDNVVVEEDLAFKSAYSFGFNGKEMDNETYGSGNEYDYGFRIYNPRIGKFLSVDPLTKSYPWYTPYQFAGNKPIACIDLDGLEEICYVVPFTENQSTTVQKIFNKADAGKQVLSDFWKMTKSNPADVIAFESDLGTNIGGLTVFVPNQIVQGYINGDEGKTIQFNHNVKDLNIKDIKTLLPTLKEIADKGRDLFLVSLESGTMKNGEGSPEKAAEGAFNFGHEMKLHVVGELKGTNVKGEVHTKYQNQDVGNNLSQTYEYIKPDSEAGKDKDSYQKAASEIKKETLTKKSETKKK